LGNEIATGEWKSFLVPVAMVMGWFVISAEPAVAVLEKQIEEVSSGAIPGRAIKLSLAIAVACASGLAMFRMIYEVPLMYILLPGYLATMVLMFLSLYIYTAIAFDSGAFPPDP